jgi:hypothetical protein
LNERLYAQLARLLDDMEAADRDETMTFPQRISALIAVARVQKMFADLRKGDFNDGSAGSEIRRYSQAFARQGSHGSGIREADAGAADDSPDEFDA